MLRKDDISEMEMTPKVGVCAAHRVGDHDREQDHAGAQRNSERRAESDAPTEEAPPTKRRGCAAEPSMDFA